MTASLLFLVLVVGGDHGWTRRGRSNAADSHPTAAEGPIHARGARTEPFHAQRTRNSSFLPGSEKALCLTDASLAFPLRAPHRFSRGPDLRTNLGGRPDRVNARSCTPVDKPVDGMWTGVHTLWSGLWKAWTALWGTRPAGPRHAC